MELYTLGKSHEVHDEKQAWIKKIQKESVVNVEFNC